MQEKELSKYLSGIYRITKGSINQKISGFNIRATQSDILIFINEHPGLTQKEIARANCVDPSLLARDLTLLESFGWVIRKADAKDQRKKSVTLTPSGKQLAEKLKAISQQWWQSFKASHPEVDVETFSNLSAQIYNIISSKEEHD
jgi:DNA-binding MarR family transcriptional regulator